VGSALTSMLQIAKQTKQFIIPSMDLITTTTTTHLKKLKLQLNCDYFAARNRLLSTTIGSANGQSTAHRLQFETT